MAVRRENHERRETKLVNALVVILPVLAFLGGLGVNLFNMAEKVATRPWVDERVIDAKRFAEERAAAVLKEAFDHSDMNRQLMAIEIEKYGSTVKSLEVKIDSMNVNIERLYKDAVDNRSHGRK